MAPPDAPIRRALVLTIAGVASVPLALGAAAALPERTRAPLFLLGLAAAASLGITGGAMGRSALARGTSTPVRAGVIAMIGLTVGVTAAVFGVWSLVGVLA